MEKEPDFAGEKMKLPSQKVSSSLSGKAEKQTAGFFILILFVALAVILVGLFYWYKSTSVTALDTEIVTRPTAEMNKEPETTNAVAEVASFGAMSTSDEITAIEADLESTNFDSLESELLQIETELETSIIQ